MRFLCAVRCGLCILYGVYCILECMARTPRTNATLKLPKNFHFLSPSTHTFADYLCALHIFHFGNNSNRKNVCCAVRSLAHAHIHVLTIFKTILEQRLFLLLHNCKCFIHFLVFVSASFLFIRTQPLALSLRLIHCEDADSFFSRAFTLLCLLQIFYTNLVSFRLLCVWRLRCLSSLIAFFSTHSLWHATPCLFKRI